MERILDIELTSKEKERVRELREQYGANGFLYIVHCENPEPCDEIVWSLTQISEEELADAEAENTVMYITDK